MNGTAEDWRDTAVVLRDDPGYMLNAWELLYDGTSTLNFEAGMFDLATKKVKEIADYSDRVDLVTHSYGGVVARYWLSSGNFPDAGEIIRRLVMIGPPHHGSQAAAKTASGDPLALIQRYFLAKVDPKAPLYEQLTPGNNNLVNLQDAAIPSPIESCVVAGYGHVFPGDDLTHNEAKNHDDYAVSISSASLIDQGVPLYLVNLSHAQELPINDSLIFTPDPNYVSASFVFDLLTYEVENNHPWPPVNIQNLIKIPDELVNLTDPELDINRGGLIVQTGIDITRVRIEEDFNALRDLIKVDLPPPLALRNFYYHSPDGKCKGSDCKGLFEGGLAIGPRACCGFNYELFFYDKKGFLGSKSIILAPYTTTLIKYP